MLWYCRGMLLTTFVLSFWAKGKIKVYLSGDTSYFCGLPFYSLEINSVYGLSLNGVNLAVNSAIFVLLYLSIAVIFTKGKQWMKYLTAWWLTALLIGTLSQVWGSFPLPLHPTLLLLLFYGYTAFSGLTALSLLRRTTDNGQTHDGDQI